MPGRAKHRSKAPPVGWLPVIVLVAVLGAVAANALGALDGLSGQARDALIEVRAEGRAAPSTVVLIDVDGPTVDALDGGLPLPRDAYADAIRRLDALGARAVVIDVQFTEPGPDEDADADLLAAMEDTDVPVVLATSEVLSDGDTAVFGGRVNLEPAGAVAAHSSMPFDADRSIRNIQRTVDGLPSLAQATLLAVGRKGLAGEVVPLDPVAPGNRLDRISLKDLLGDGDRDRRLVRGRVAVVGVTVAGPTGDDDQRIAGSSDRIAGVEAQANAIDTALRGAPLRDAGDVGAYVVALLAGLLAALGTRGGMRIQLAAVGAAGIGVIVAAALAVKLDVILDPVPAIVALVLGGTGAAAARAAAERTRRAAARATLARFVPPGIVDEVLDEDGLLAPQAQTATVLFCDLRGYTSLVAGLERPESLITVLDAYLSAVTATVHAHEGTVVSFQGDGVMCAFGVPVPTERSAAQAVAAARDLQAVALPRVVAELADVLPGAKDLALGVGVATGTVFAGTVGPPARREYAVVGPTTNLAARLQALTKTEHVGVIADDATAQAIGDGSTQKVHVGIDLGSGDLRPLGSRTIRGLPRPIDVWTLAPPEA